MVDIVLDSNVLADFLIQYFGPARYGQANFIAQDSISKELSRRINQIIHWHRWEIEEENTTQYPGLIVVSTLAFVEIARQWEIIVDRRFTIEQFAGFIEQPPEWFVIEPIDEHLVEAFSYLPIEILTPSGKIKPIEWTDAVHIATALSRGEQCLLATTDRRIEQIESLHGRIL